MILVEPEIITVETEVNVEVSVAIVVRNSSLREGPLRRTGKFESVAFE